MSSTPRVFISYSTSDRATAEKLYTDLLDAGADVFQFERWAKPGTPAWDEVLGWIESSDVFIVLMSKSALKSRPVQEEVAFAYYQYVNSNQPMLIPALLEPDLKLFREIRRFTRLELYDYKAGLSRLTRDLGLEKAPKPAGKPKARSDVPLGSLLEGTSAPPGLQRRPTGTSSSRTWQQLARDSGSPRTATTPAPTYTGDGLSRYVVVISLIAIVGAVAGFAASHFLLGFLEENLQTIPDFFASLSDNWAWLPWVTGVVVLIVTAINAFIVTDNEIPVDSYDYAIVSLKSVVAALFLTLLWVALFWQVSSDVFLRLFAPIGVAVTAATIIIYALLDEW